MLEKKATSAAGSLIGQILDLYAHTDHPGRLGMYTRYPVKTVRASNNAKQFSRGFGKQP